MISETYKSPEGVTLTASEVAQLRWKLYRIQRSGVSTTVYNHARLILQMLSKAERLEIRAIKKQQRNERESK